MTGGMYRGQAFQFGKNIPMFSGAPFQHGRNMPMFRGPAQYGGYISVYAGSPYQYGNGLGDILRGIGRFLFPIIAPIASRAASSFISSTAGGLEEGKSFKDSALAAIKPTISNTLESAKDQVMKRVQGGGRVYKRRKTSKKVKKISKRKVSRKHKSKAKRARNLSAEYNF